MLRCTSPVVLLIAFVALVICWADAGHAQSRSLVGACCFLDGTCFVTDEPDCVGQGAEFKGNDTDCNPNPCNQPGACCFLDGTCFVTDEGDCLNQGAEYKGNGTDCNPNPCNQPGACCFLDGTCFVTDEGDCLNQGAEYKGNGTDCNPNPCNQPGACCFLDGTCFVTDEGDCLNQGAEYQGNGTTCSPNPCPQGPPANDDCEDAVRIGSNETILGTVQGATPSDVPPCVFVQSGPGNSQPDVWYSVIGTGFEMEAELCIPQDNPLANELQQTGKIHVYCGDCEGLNCIASVSGNVFECDADRAPAKSSGSGLARGENELEVEWCSEEGVEYFIRVSYGSLPGSRNHLTEFVLEVESDDEDKCDPEPCGVRQEDFCEDAQPVCPFITYEGHTFDATSAYFDHGGTIDTIFFCGLVFGVYDVWYRYTPAENGLMFVHVEGPPTDFVFGVYDDCDEATGNLLACNVAYHHGVVVWPVQAYETYYIRIAGRNFTRGEFELDLVAPPCANGLDMQHLTE